MNDDVGILQEWLRFAICGDPMGAGSSVLLPMAAHTRLAVLNRDRAREIIDEFSEKLRALK